MDAVGLAVEVLRAQEVRDLDHRVTVDQQRTDDRLLGIDGLRRKAVDGHLALLRRVNLPAGQVLEMVRCQRCPNNGVMDEVYPPFFRGVWSCVDACPRQSTRRMTPISFPWMCTSS